MHILSLQSLITAAVILKNKYLKELFFLLLKTAFYASVSTSSRNYLFPCPPSACQTLPERQGIWALQQEKSTFPKRYQFPMFVGLFELVEMTLFSCIWNKIYFLAMHTGVFEKAFFPRSWNSTWAVLFIIPRLISL